MAKFQAQDTTSGAIFSFDGVPPFDLAAVPGIPDGVFEVREVSAVAAQTITINNAALTSPVLEYDLLSATPTLNNGSSGSANDLLIANVNVDQVAGLQTRRNVSFTATPQFAPVSGGSFTIHMRFEYTEYVAGAGYNLFSTSHAAGSNDNGTVATYMDNSEVWLFPTTPGDTNGGKIAYLSAPQVGVIYDYVMTYDWATREFTLYIDGVLQGSYVRGAQISVDPAVPWNIGCMADLTGFRLPADIKAVTYFGRVLSAQEVLDTYA